MSYGILNKAGAYQMAFHAQDITSPAMRAAIEDWYGLYYLRKPTKDEDPCQQIPHTIVRKLTKTTFSEYNATSKDAFAAQILNALKSKRKTVSIQVKPNEVIVRAPTRMKQNDIEKFVESKRVWIEKHLKSLSEKQKLLENIEPYSNEEIRSFIAKAKEILQKLNKEETNIITVEDPIEMDIEGINQIHKIAPNIHVITHLIFGIPQETTEDMLNSVKFVLNAQTDGIKFTVLHVLENTDLAVLWKEGKFQTMSQDEYFYVLKKAIVIIENF